MLNSTNTDLAPPKMAVVTADESEVNDLDECFRSRNLSFW